MKCILFYLVDFILFLFLIFINYSIQIPIEEVNLLINLLEY